jgi:DNA repair protein RAD5
VHGFDGQTNPKARTSAINAFQQRTQGEKTVFVATLKAGCEGMTLTAGTRLYFMSPCLDPSAEAQAIGRIHRVGQVNDVVFKRFCYNDSLDSTILEIREKLGTGGMSIVDGRYCADALDLLHHTLDRHRNEYRSAYASGATKGPGE